VNRVPPPFLVHVAGPPVDGVQRCTYCRAVLVDADHNPVWWRVGVRVATDKKSPDGDGTTYRVEPDNRDLANDEQWCNTIAPKAPWRWMEANGLPTGIPDAAELVVDEQAGTITVEMFATDPNGRIMLHAGIGVMTRLETFPLKVPPPPGLLEAYQRTIDRVRRERDAASAIRYETAQTLIRELGLDPITVFDALHLPVPTIRQTEGAPWEA
jgi:hypothetical protein